MAQSCTHARFEAAEAVKAVRRFEDALLERAAGDDFTLRRFEDEDVELFEMDYRVALLKLKKAAPALNVRPGELLGLSSHEMPMTVCQCGTGRIPACPWVPFREEFGVCECECDEHVACGACAWLDVDEWRDKWIEWGHPMYTQPAPLSVQPVQP